MEGTIKMKGIFGRKSAEHAMSESAREDGKTSLLDVEVGKTYIVKEIDTTDEEMNAFLFRLGCYSGEPVTVISKKKKSCIVAIKDSRYGLDNQLAKAVIV